MFIAAMFLIRRGSDAAPLAAGLGLGVILCPITMGAVMWLLMHNRDESPFRQGDDQ